MMSKSDLASLIADECDMPVSLVAKVVKALLEELSHWSGDEVDDLLASYSEAE